MSSDSVRQLLQTSSGDINRRNDAGRSKLSDSLKLYCNQEIENATILLTKSIEQLSLTQDVQRNSTLMLVENKTSLIAGTLRKGKLSSESRILLVDLYVQ